MSLDNGTVKISAPSFKNLANIWSIATALFISNTAFKIQVVSTSAIKCRGNFRIFQFASEISFLTVETTCSAWIIMYTYNTLELVKRKTILPLMITLFWFLSVSLQLYENTLSNAKKNPVLKYSSVWKVSNANWVITKNQLKRRFWKNKEIGDDAKKVLTKEFTPYKIRQKSLRKRKQHSFLIFL